MSLSHEFPNTGDRIADHVLKYRWFGPAHRLLGPELLQTAFDLRDEVLTQKFGPLLSKEETVPLADRVTEILDNRRGPFTDEVGYGRRKVELLISETNTGETKRYGTLLIGLGGAVLTCFTNKTYSYKEFHYPKPHFDWWPTSEDKYPVVLYEYFQEFFTPTSKDVRNAIKTRIDEELGVFLYVQQSAGLHDRVRSAIEQGKKCVDEGIIICPGDDIHYANFNGLRRLRMTEKPILNEIEGLINKGKTIQERYDRTEERFYGGHEEIREALSPR